MNKNNTAIFQILRSYSIKMKGCGCKDKVNCPHIGPGPMGKYPPWGVFLRNPVPYFREFRRKSQKTANGYVDKRDRGSNLAHPVFQFERRRAQPLVGPLQKKEEICYASYGSLLRH